MKREAERHCVCQCDRRQATQHGDGVQLEIEIKVVATRGGMQIDGIYSNGNSSNNIGHFNRLSIVASKQLKMFQLN